MFLRNLFWIEWRREIRRQCQLATSPELFGRVCFIDLIRFDSWFSRDFELKERKLVVGIIFDRFREFFQTRISNPFSAYFRASLIQKFNDLAVLLLVFALSLKHSSSSPPLLFLFSVNTGDTSEHC